VLSVMKLSVIMLSSNVLLFNVLSVIMLNGIILSYAELIIPSAIMLNRIRQTVRRLNGIRLNADTLKVVKADRHLAYYH